MTAGRHPRFLDPRAPARILAAGGFLAVVGCLTAVGCSREAGPPAARSGLPAAGKGEGVRRMAERLEGITRGLDPKKNIFLNTERVAMLKAGIEENPGSRAEILPKLAEELLKAGRTEEAIAASESLLKL